MIALKCIPTDSHTKMHTNCWTSDGYSWRYWLLEYCII